MRARKRRTKNKQEKRKHRKRRTNNKTQAKMKPLFTEREIRAAAIFLPLALLALGCLLLARPKPDMEAVRRAEERAEQGRDTLRPRPFDPNTVTYEQLRAMGLTQTEAASLLRYRSYDKVFRIPEDVAACYGIDDSLYRLLAPHIRIARRYAKTPEGYGRDRKITNPIPPSPFRVDTVSARYLQAIGALTHRQARTFVKWRDTHPITDMEELRKCYAIDDSVAQALEPYLIFDRPEPAAPLYPIELNDADSATLVRADGIGEKTAGRIVRYRERLGGYVRPEQLTEVEGITERNYEKILRQICCDSCRIKKIHINFATSEELRRHPYMTPPLLRKILKTRQLKGGWSTPEAFNEENGLKPGEAARLAPYLSFAPPGGADDE